MVAISLDAAIRLVRREIMETPPSAVQDRLEFACERVERALRALNVDGVGVEGADRIEAYTELVGAPVAESEADPARALVKAMAVEGDRWDELYRHAQVLVQAFATYTVRDRERRGVWRRSGIKGQVFHLFAKAERAFMEVMQGRAPNNDHFIDAINYAVFAARLIDDFDLTHARVPADAELNGEWPWGT
jgi:hypothetical protein